MPKDIKLKIYSQTIKVILLKRKIMMMRKMKIMMMMRMMRRMRRKSSMFEGWFASRKMDRR